MREIGFTAAAAVLVSCFWVFTKVRVLQDHRYERMARN